MMLTRLGRYVDLFSITSDIDLKTLKSCEFCGVFVILS